MGPSQERILDLVEQWHQAEQEGRLLSLERLCADCPELIDAVRQQIELADRMERLARPDDLSPPTVPPLGSNPSKADQCLFYGCMTPPNLEWPNSTGGMRRAFWRRPPVRKTGHRGCARCAIFHASRGAIDKNLHLSSRGT